MPDPHSPDALFAVVAADIAVILVAGLLLGRLARRLGQPPVIGEIVAGIALGPSLLGLLPGHLTTLVFPTGARPYLSLVAQLGVVLFMFTVGWEFDAAVLRGRLLAVPGVTFGGVALPFALGIGVAAVVHSRHATVHGSYVGLLPLALFLGVAMSISAFPVLARLLTDRGIQHTRIGTLALASAAMEDVLAWCLLAVVAATVSAGGAGRALPVLLRFAGYAVAMAFGLRPALRRVLGRWTPSPAGLAVLLAAGTLLSAATTSWVGVHPIFGAFAFGLVLRRDGGRSWQVAVQPLRQAATILLPVFFIVTGLSVDIAALPASGWAEFGLILLVACTGKLIGAAVPARLSGMTRRESVGVGLLMNTRGLTELIVLNIGLGLGVLDGGLFTVMVLMALVTTAMAGPLLPFVLPAGHRAAGSGSGSAGPVGPAADAAQAA